MAKKGRKNKKLSRRKRASRKVSLYGENANIFQLLSYVITDEPLENSSIPEEIQDEMESIFHQLPKRPKIVIERLKVLIEEYPHVPQLYNNISVAYSNLGDKEKSKYYAEKNYRNNSRYLFAKLNYAEICMMEGNFEKVPEILENKFDIKALYPEREVFHISEAVGFMGIAGWYLVHVNKAEQAEIYLDWLKKLAPNHPYTKRLKKYIFMRTVKEGLSRFFLKSEKKNSNGVH